MQPTILHEQALTLAESVPQLIRKHFGNIPVDPAELISTDHFYRNTAIGLGAALGAATFTRLISRPWKYITGGVAIGLGIAGMRLGKLEDEIDTTLRVAVPAVKEAVLQHADMLEKNPEMRQQLATYLQNDLTPQQIAGKDAETLLLAKSLFFIETLPSFNRGALVNTISQKLKCAQEPGRPECAAAR